MNTITFQVSKTKEIEPEKYIYGVIIKSGDLEKSLNLIETIIKNNRNVVKENIINHNFVLPEKNTDLKSIQIYKVSDRNSLEDFTNQLSKIEGIQGGVIKAEVKDKESEEFELLKELTQDAKSKAKKYAQLCDKEIMGITSFKVLSSNQGGWTAYPPLSGINEQTIYSSIMMQYGKKNKVEISKIIEVEFEMK